MKKSFFCWICLVTVGMISLLWGEAFAGRKNWVLYDDFTSNNIDTERWIINSISADITVEDGKAKFVHIPGKAGISAWLRIKENPEGVKGIRAKVTVQSCSGPTDVQARVAGFIGKVAEDGQVDYVWDQLILEGATTSPRAFGGLVVLRASDYAFRYDLFYGQFVRPVDIVGHTFTLTIIFSEDKVVFEVDGLGEIEHKLPECLIHLSTYDNTFKGIGTISASGQGSCTVYFDDVYVLR